ncbi:hypothetical protein A28LD_0364 [Idiomarina sp. A28L]|uniref:hypothetical protein n=1 Tax=Idiomarina sp. A28L TaxID=1036674 RepID=UPI0002138A6D|nr:hypothetical protein [Idiomarina sp. A28L]EGN75876.1 hypothetical protein A28LD_0364 [Idiomarina sp. A28L]
MVTTELVKDSDGNHILIIPEEFEAEFSGVDKVDICREGQCLIITPIRKSWSSLADAERADEDFLTSRPDVITPNKDSE